MLLESKKRSGAPLIDLTLSNPTACGFTYLKDPVFRELSHPDNASYEPDPRGLFSARRAISKYYAERGAEVPPDRIFLTSGTSEAYSFLFRLLAEPGEAVLAPAPGYPLFDSLADLNDLRLEKYSLAYRGGWKLDERSLERLAQAAPAAIVWIHPNNPTGNYASSAEAAALLRFCRKEECALIADEVFLDYPFDGARPSTFAAEKDTLSFTLSGVSKILGLPQMKLSWIVVGGPAVEAEEAMRRLEIIADTYLSVNTPSQNALPGWLGHSREAISEIRGRVAANRRALQAAKGLEVLEAGGGWHAVLRGKGIADEDFAVRLLEEKNTLAHPGYLFDFESEDCLVVSLLPPPAIFAEGVSSLRP